MKKLAEYVGHELKWVQPHAAKMEYELRAGDTVVANLGFRSSFGSFATASSADGTWTFKRVGFFQTKATIRANGLENDLAVFINNTWSGGGTLEFPDGRKYPANTNFWATQFDFTTGMNDPLISYRQIGGLLQMSAATEIHPIAKNIPEMPCMVLFGWYLIVMMNMDSSTMTSITASLYS